MKSMVDHPDHYQAGGFECIDVMLAVKSFCLLNAFKYLYRSEKKNGIEDLKKASWYLNKIFELEE